jgi:hypothetical protein
MQKVYDACNCVTSMQQKTWRQVKMYTARDSVGNPASPFRLPRKGKPKYLPELTLCLNLAQRTAWRIHIHARNRLTLDLQPYIIAAHTAIAAGIMLALGEPSRSRFKERTQSGQREWRRGLRKKQSRLSPMLCSEGIKASDGSQAQEKMTPR